MRSSDLSSKSWLRRSSQTNSDTYCYSSVCLHLTDTNQRTVSRPDALWNCKIYIIFALIHKTR